MCGYNPNTTSWLLREKVGSIKWTELKNQHYMPLSQIATESKALFPPVTLHKQCSLGQKYWGGTRAVVSIRYPDHCWRVGASPNTSLTVFHWRYLGFHSWETQLIPLLISTSTKADDGIRGTKFIVEMGQLQIGKSWISLAGGGWSWIYFCNAFYAWHMVPRTADKWLYLNGDIEKRTANDGAHGDKRANLFPTYSLKWMVPALKHWNWNTHRNNFRHNALDWGPTAITPSPPLSLCKAISYFLTLYGE